jgi:hypothetical protein
VVERVAREREGVTLTGERGVARSVAPTGPRSGLTLWGGPDRWGPLSYIIFSNFQYLKNFQKIFRRN